MPPLARHLITLDDGHEVGVAVSGHGVPLVVVHGFSAEGILYAQTLSRIVSLGFKVVAIDVAGHGATLGLPTGAGTLTSYTELLGKALNHLGAERAGRGAAEVSSGGGGPDTPWAAASSPSSPPTTPSKRSR